MSREIAASRSAIMLVGRIWRIGRHRRTAPDES
jgi:hypothetical protein